MSPDSTVSDWRFLRPLGYVDPQPVVEPLDVRRLFIGNRHAAAPAAHDRRFDTVVSLTTERQPLTTHHHQLVDGPGHDWPTFAAAVDTVRQRSGCDGDVLVHCKAGVSRSTAVLSTAITAETDRSFHEALAVVERARPTAVPNPALVVSALAYLAADR